MVIDFPHKPNFEETNQIKKAKLQNMSVRV